jgi:hypothetical protein
VSLIPTLYCEIVAVPNVAPDIPICFIRMLDIVVGFSPNCFVCLVDLQPKRPMICVLPKPFAAGCCGLCAETIGERNLVVDLDSADIYRVGITFKSPEIYARFVDRNALRGFAVVTQRLFEPEAIADVLHLLEGNRDVLFVLSFWRLFFSLLPSPIPRRLIHTNKKRRRRLSIPETTRELVQDMEVEFPSASRQSRFDFFAYHLGQERKPVDDACAKVLTMLKDQNNTVLVLRTSISDWIDRYHPAPFWQAVVNFALHNEAIACDCPKIPCLKQETQSTAEIPISRTARYRMRECALFQEPLGSEVDEVRYWMERVGNIMEWDVSDFICATVSGFEAPLRPRALSMPQLLMSQSIDDLPSLPLANDA